jgi:hypothetical protein
MVDFSSGGKSADLAINEKIPRTVFAIRKSLDLNLKLLVQKIKKS